jgi:hypothetical protein
MHKLQLAPQQHILDYKTHDMKAFLIANGQNFSEMNLQGPDRSDNVGKENLAFLRSDKLAKKITNKESSKWKNLANKTIKIGNIVFRNEFPNRFAFGSRLTGGWREQIRRKGNQNVTELIRLH